MAYYKGHCGADKPVNGGKYVEEHGYGHEEFNFMPIQVEGGAEAECLGFVEPKSNAGTRNTFHIERIEGCAKLTRAPFIEDVLVVWCATRERGDTTVVGWYQHATVWRKLQEWLPARDGYGEKRVYNVRARAADCTLLPVGERNIHIWSIPSARYTRAYGFGQSMVWYPTEPKAQPFVSRLVEHISRYCGVNWLDTYPPDFPL